MKLSAVLALLPASPAAAAALSNVAAVGAGAVHPFTPAEFEVGDTQDSRCDKGCVTVYFDCINVKGLDGLPYCGQEMCDWAVGFHCRGCQACVARHRGDIAADVASVLNKESTSTEPKLLTSWQFTLPAETSTSTSPTCTDDLLTSGLFSLPAETSAPMRLQAAVESPDGTVTTPLVSHLRSEATAETRSEFKCPPGMDKETHDWWGKIIVGKYMPWPCTPIKTGITVTTSLAPVRIQAGDATITTTLVNPSRTQAAVQARGDDDDDDAKSARLHPIPKPKGPKVSTIYADPVVTVSHPRASTGIPTTFETKTTKKAYTTAVQARADADDAKSIRRPPKGPKVSTIYSKAYATARD